MKSKIILVVSTLFITFLLVYPATAQMDDATTKEPAFFYTLNDVPLMPGLVELPEETILFDKPGGRIGESAAISETLTKEKIKSFYNNTLPHLGWQKTVDGSFVRQNEILQLEIEEKDGASIVEVKISPAKN